MMRLYIIIVGLIIVNFSCAQKPANNEKDFYEKAINGESVYLEMDTIMTLPMIHKPSKIQSHLEVLWDSDRAEGVYLAEYSYGEAKGTRLICKCNESEMIPFIESQYQAAKSIKQGRFSFSFNTGDMNFQTKNCLSETLPLTPKYNRPVLAEIMNGNFKQNGNTDYLDIPLSSEFIVVNRKGRIYLEGNIPDENITFIGIGKKHRLQSITTLDGKLIYPPKSTPDWKKSLVSKGFFTGNIIPSSSNWSHQTTFGLNEYLDQGIDVGVVINIDENLKNIENGIKIKGAIEVMVDKGRDTTIQTQLPFYKPGKIIVVKTKDNFSINRKDKVENEGSLSFDGTNTKIWSNIKLTRFNINTREHSVISNIKNDEQKFIQEIELAEKEVLYMEMTTILPESMYIPLDLNLDKPVINSLKTNELTLQHYAINYNNSNNTTNALIKLELFANQNKIISLSELEAWDNNDNALKANHKLEKDEVWGNDSISEIKIDIGIEKLQGNVQSIRIKGKLNIEDGTYPPSGDITVLPFEEIISLSGDVGSTNSTPNPLALKPFRVSWSNIDYMFNSQGITANFYVPNEEDVNFLNILTSKSKVLTLLDGDQNDLQIEHKATFSDRLQYLKHSTTRYAFDDEDDINLNNQLISYIDRTRNPVSFSIVQYREPSTNFMEGEIEVTLLGYKNSANLKRKTYNFDAIPSQINLQVGDDIFVYKNGDWGERDKDGNKYTKYRNSSYPEKVHIKSIKVYDDTDGLLSIAEGKDYNNINSDARFLLVKEKYSGPLKIDIEYYELEEFTRRYPFEISFDIKSLR